MNALASLLLFAQRQNPFDKIWGPDNPTRTDMRQLTQAVTDNSHDYTLAIIVGCVIIAGAIIIASMIRKRRDGSTN